MGESLVFSFISFPQAKHRKALPEINDIEFHLLVRGSCLGKSAFPQPEEEKYEEKEHGAGRGFIACAGRMECSRCGGDLYLGSRHCHGGTYRYERIENAGSGGNYHG